MAPPFADIVEWRLRPETLILEGVAYEGFSYALRFRSNKRSIHQILMVGTWELGGRATGNTLLYQGQVNPPVYTCAKNTTFTTACWRQLGDVGKPDGYSFQFSSRYSPIQCFDFQHGPAGCLYGYWPEFVAVKSLLQKNQDNLDRGLQLLAPFYRVFNNAVGNGRWFDNYIQNLSGQGLPGLLNLAGS